MSLTSQLTTAANQGAADILHLTSAETTTIFTNAIGAGLLLTIVTVIATQWVADRTIPKPGEPPMTVADSLLACANVFFLCVGMSAIMILVSNSLARAFAIGAAIALVRFRIKLNRQALGAALLFGVITGMACGVNQTQTAWLIATIYSVAILTITIISNWIHRRGRNATGPLAQFVDVTRAPRLELVGTPPAAPIRAITPPPLVVHKKHPVQDSALKVSDLGLPLPPSWLQQPGLTAKVTASAD